MKHNLQVLAVVAVVVAVAAAMVGVSVTALAAEATPAYTETIKVAHISDIHVMIEEYCNIYSDTYKASGVTSYKMLEQTESIVEAVLDSICEQPQKPTYLFATGDLTSNGELANHLYVADVFAKVTDRMRNELGVPDFQVFAIPGNHDIDNQHAHTYMPQADDEEWMACTTYEQKLEYLTNYTKVGVQGTSSLQFMGIYSDFGYCNCPNRKEGVHEAPCKMAQGCSLEFFYESDYWYDDTTVRHQFHPASLDQAIALAEGYTYEKAYTGDGFDNSRDLPKDVEKAWKADGKNYELVAEYCRLGACSYIARVNGLTVVGLDGNTRHYTGIKEGETNPAILGSNGWHESTGGYISPRCIQWVADSLQTNGDVANKQWICALAHENVLPHFDTEDEVISLFTYDNWEQLYTNLADNGVRYAFTGHQHTNDIESAVSQSGNLLYDFQTGSTASMGSGWREVTMTKSTYADNSYAEDVYSTVHFMYYNDKLDGEDCFRYERYSFDADKQYTKQPVYLKKDGQLVSLAEVQGESLYNMIPNMAHNYVNDQLESFVRGKLSGLKSTKAAAFYELADKAVADIFALNMYRFVVHEDGSFSLSDTPEPGYHLTQYANDLVDYILNLDFSFGELEQKTTIGELLWRIYGGHLVGANHFDIPDNIQLLLDRLENGQVIRFIENLLYEGVVPQLELILKAPIYWGDTLYFYEMDGEVTADMVAGGKGIDLHEFADMFRNPSAYVDDMMISMVIGVVYDQMGPIEADEDDPGRQGIDISSVYNLVRTLPAALDSIFDAFKQLIDIRQLVADNFGLDIDKYLNLAIPYIQKLDGKTIKQLIKDELLDKYVTDAFCVNLGTYGAYIVRSFVVDESADGVTWTNADGFFPFASQPNFHVQANYAVTDSNAVYKPIGPSGAVIEQLAGHTYYCDKDGNDRITVKPTKENGLLPSKISIAPVIDQEGQLDVTAKTIRWYTSLDVDYTQLDKTFQSEIMVADNDRFEGATTHVVTGVNRIVEYPTVDLGIIYINLTCAHRQYNDYQYTLTGLQPNKTYYYKLRSAGREWTQTYSFVTPTQEGGFSLMAMSDIQGSIKQNYQASLPNMQKAVAAGSPQYIISAGDNVDNGKNISQWEWLLDVQDDIWAQNTFVGVAGNHEKKNACISNVLAIPDAVVEDSGYYYAYTQQNVQFIMLNTNEAIARPNGDAKTAGEKQYVWLEEQLKAANDNSKIEFIVVVMHKGPYTAGSHAFDADVIALRAELTPLFARYNVDVVLQGHDHTYSVSEYIGGDYDQAAKRYKAVDVAYDATGAAVDPNGVLYVNLGTMGDKYYNYIYSSEVTLKDRSKDVYLRAKLSQYLTADGNLELSPVRNSKTVMPETPVYVYLNVQQGRLSITSYTVINGVSYVVDDMAITKKAVAATESVTVMGKTIAPDKLAQLPSVRVGVDAVDGTEYYIGYHLRDILAAAGDKKSTVFTYDGTQYNVADTYVMIAKTTTVGGAGEAITPTCMVAGANTYLFFDSADAKGGMPGWVIAVIVVAAVVVVVGIVFLFVLRRNKAKASTEAEAQATDKGETQQAEDAVTQQSEEALSSDDAQN